MQVLNLSFNGIYSNTNNLNDQTINGGLLKADNIVIDQPNVAKSRRGFKVYNENADSIESMATYRSNLLSFTDSDMLVDNGSGTYTTLSTDVESPLDTKKFHYVESNKNFYFCDKKGVMKIDSLSATPFLAGVVEALGVETFTSLSSGTAIPDKKQVAYRIVYGYKDSNNNLILGAPSDRRIFQNNSGGAVNVQGKVIIPEGIDEKYFYQVYRSTYSDYDPGNSIDVTPDDELQLVLETSISAGMLSNGYFEFVDKTPESLMGSFLYTNETQEGITQANYQPPLCKDAELYKSSVFYANTKTIATYSTSLLGTDSNTDSPKVLYPGNWIKISFNDNTSNIIFTAKTTVTDPNVEFELIDTGSPAEDIEATIKNFISCVNNYVPSGSDPECPVYGYYSSSDSDIPGKFTLKAKNYNSGEIKVITDKAGAFFPIMQSAKVISEENKNRVYFSKPQQPESVPLLNYIDVGSANYEIKRIVALRDSLFVLKTDGIYRISGESASSFTCKLFDGTTNIIAPETAVAFNNMVYCVADQGIITISETGVSIISMPIENDLFELSEYANFSTLSFAIAYSSDRKYILFVPTTPEDTTCTQAFIYNSYTNTFVRWTLNANCGIVRPNEEKQGELFYGTSSGITYKERKSFTLEDYADEEYSVTIIDIDTSHKKVTVSSLPSEVQVGYTIKQGNKSSLIEKIVERIVIPDDPNDPVYTVFDLTLSNNYRYEIDDAVIYKPIDKIIEWFPITCNNPSFFKHFREITFMFLDASFNKLYFSVYSDSSPDSEDTEIVATSLGAWDDGQWGRVMWGGEIGGRQAIRSYIPLEKTRCRWLDLSLSSNQALTQFSVSGISLMYSLASERDTR